MGLADQPDTLVRWMADMERRMRTAETATRATRTSITDLAGTERVRIGQQHDGTFGIWIDGGPIRATSYVTGAAQVNNVSLTTTEQFFASVTLAVPSWAVTALVDASLVFQMSNGSGATQRMIYSARIEGVPTGGWTHSVAAGLTANTTDLTARTLTRPTLGSTVTVSAMCRVGESTNAANVVRVLARAVFLR